MAKSTEWLKRRRDIRLAIYERDNHRCIYCGREVRQYENGGRYDDMATLDHIVAANIAPDKIKDTSNLVTCCGKCNSTKRDLSVTDYVINYLHFSHNKAKKLAAKLDKLQPVLM